MGSVRTGSACRQVAFRFGHRLTACFRSGYRGGKPLRHPALFHRQTRASGSYRSLPLRPAPQSVIESACAYGFGSLSTALQERIRLSPLHRVSACFAALTPDCFTLRQAQCSTSCPATPNGSPLHTQGLQSSGSPFPFPASPMLSLRSGLSVGYAYPKSCTMPLARQARHRPLNTCPHRHNHEIKP